MDKELIAVYDRDRSVLRNKIAASDDTINYEDIFTLLVEALHEEGEDYEATPDPDRITVIDHGDYQGTMVFVVGETGYQPCTYWMSTVAYGSCSTCDTLLGIIDGEGWQDDGSLGEAQVKDIETLALHILQGMKRYEA